MSILPLSLFTWHVAFGTFFLKNVQIRGFRTQEPALITNIDPPHKILVILKGWVEIRKCAVKIIGIESYLKIAVVFSLDMVEKMALNRDQQNLNRVKLLIFVGLFSELFDHTSYVALSSCWKWELSFPLSFLSPLLWAEVQIHSPAVLCRPSHNYQLALQQVGATLILYNIKLNWMQCWIHNVRSYSNNSQGWVPNTAPPLNGGNSSSSGAISWNKYHSFYMHKILKCLKRKKSRHLASKCSWINMQLRLQEQKLIHIFIQNIVKQASS